MSSRRYTAGMFSTFFLVSALERAVKTGAQSALLAAGAGQFVALSADWPMVGSFALGGFIISALTSLASGAVGDPDSPSLV